MVLTHYVQGVRVVDGSKLVLHQTGVVALVRRHHALHDQGPVLAAHLVTRDGNTDTVTDVHVKNTHANTKTCK